MTRSITAAEYRAQLAAQMTERQMQDHVLAAARSLGWIAYHTHDSRRSQPGFPDLVLVHPVQRRVLWRELKTERGRVTAAQDQWIHALTRARQNVAVWRPADHLEGRILADLQLPARAWELDAPSWPSPDGGTSPARTWDLGDTPDDEDDR